MFFREYKPTCIESLFGKPPSKFKAHVIVPGNKDLNLDLHQCNCCIHRTRRQCPAIMERKSSDSSSSDQFIGKAEHSHVCKQEYLGSKEKQHCSRNHLRKMEKRKIKKRSNKDRGGTSGLFECCCSSHRDVAECLREVNVTKDKAVQSSETSFERTCSICEEGEHEGRRYCSICQIWERVIGAEPRHEMYSSRMYENFENELPAETVVEERKIEDNGDQALHFVIESCKICGKGQHAAESNQVGNCRFQELLENSNVGICELGGQVAECTRLEGFFSSEPNLKKKAPKSVQAGDSPYVKHSSEKMSGVNFAKQSMGSICRVCKVDSLSQRSEIKLNSTKKESSTTLPEKAHSSNLIKTNGRQCKKHPEEELLEDYKRALLSELKKPVKDNTTQMSGFRNCNCEFSMKNGRNKWGIKSEFDKNEIKMIKRQCEDALAQVNQCKKEIDKSKGSKCNCDPESTLTIIQSCQGRCDQLEKQVRQLQQKLNYYGHNIGGKYEDMNEAGRENKPRWIKNQNARRMHFKEDKSGERRPWKPAGMINVRYKSPTKWDQPKTPRKDKQWPKARASSPRNPRMTCHHMKCFPAEQLPDIPSFKRCPGYPSFALQFAAGRRM